VITPPDGMVTVRYDDGHYGFVDAEEFQRYAEYRMTITSGDYRTDPSYWWRRGSRDQKS
jgi:hypothetical protein